MDKEDKKIEEMRHEVLEWAIFLEISLDEEILNHFGLDAWRASYFLKLDKERELFKECFLNISLSRKFELIAKIIKEIWGELSKDFKKNEKRFRIIRNKFAHSVYPEIAGGEFQSEIIKNQIKKEQEEWEKMYKEVKILYWKIIDEIDSKFYTENPRRRKYRKFEEDETLGLIKYYEKLLEGKSKKQ